MATDNLYEEAREMVKDTANSVDKLYSVVERLILNCELYRQQRDDAIQSIENVKTVAEATGRISRLDDNHIKFKDEAYVKVSYVQDLIRKEFKL